MAERIKAPSWKGGVVKATMSSNLISFAIFVNNFIWGGNMTEKKKKKKKFNIVPVIFLVLFASVAIFSLVKIITINSEYKKSEKEYKDIADDAIISIKDLDIDEKEKEEEVIPYLIVDHNKLYEKNSDYLAWIRVQDTEINYPVVDGVDNEKYLKRSFEGVWSSSGCIFTDCRNSTDFSDFHTIIYGHSMLDHSMFFALQRYPKSDYFYNHNKVEIYRDNKLYIYTAFSFFKAQSDGNVYFSNKDTESEKQSFINYLIRNSYFDTGMEVTPEDQIITLSTCVEAEGNDRWVLHCKLTEVIDLAKYYQ